MAALVVAVTMLSAACGSRLSHARLLADAQGARIGTQSSAGADLAGGSNQAAGNAQPGPDSSTSGTSSAQGAQSSNQAGVIAKPGAGTASGSQAGGCTGPKSELRVGSVGEMSGITGSVVVDSVRAVQAWVASINARGGVACHPVKYFVADDGGDPSRNQSQVQSMVEQDHVIAFVQMIAPMAGQASVGYLTQKGIPVIGDSSAEPWFYESPMYFPQVATFDGLLIAAFAAAGTAGRQTGKTRLGTLTCVEAQICSRANDLAPTYAAKFGMSLVYRSQASIVQPDYTSACQAAKSAGADILLVGLDANSIVRTARSCHGVNYNPLYAIVASTTGPQITSDPLLDGTVIGSITPPPTVTSPAVQEYQSTLKQYAPGVGINPASIIGWTSAMLFALATHNISEPPTSASILGGLWSIKGNDLNGLTGPLTFIKGQNAPHVYCYWLMQIKAGQYVSPDGGHRTCE